ncbi:alpha/beta hydrolase, partial [bacterium]|nr:alpha/beta hydrolase [bacterium]
MKKKVFLVHGYKSSPSGNWLPWLADELRNDGFEVCAVSLPDPAEPVMEKWVLAIRETAGEPNKDTFFVAHSLGGIAVFRYIESLPEDARIGGIFTVGGFMSSLNRRELESFFQKPLDIDKICRIAPYIVAIH